jgi:hypothetical protein
MGSGSSVAVGYNAARNLSGGPGVSQIYGLLWPRVLLRILILRYSSNQSKELTEMNLFKLSHKNTFSHIEEKFLTILVVC